MVVPAECAARSILELGGFMASVATEATPSLYEWCRQLFIY